MTRHVSGCALKIWLKPLCGYYASSKLKPRPDAKQVISLCLLDLVLPAVQVRSVSMKTTARYAQKLVTPDQTAA